MNPKTVIHTKMLDSNHCQRGNNWIPSPPYRRHYSRTYVKYVEYPIKCPGRAGTNVRAGPGGPGCSGSQVTGRRAPRPCQPCGNPASRPEFGARLGRAVVRLNYPKSTCSARRDELPPPCYRNEYTPASQLQRGGVPDAHKQACSFRRARQTCVRSPSWRSRFESGRCARSECFRGLERPRLSFSDSRLARGRPDRHVSFVTIGKKETFF